MFQPERTQISERLCELQAGYPVIEGLMLVGQGGFVLATTLTDSERIVRLAAVTRTMFLLADEATFELGCGEMESVHLTYQHKTGSDDKNTSHVMLVPVTREVTLLMALRSPNPHTNEPALLDDVRRIVTFFAHQMIS